MSAEQPTTAADPNTPLRMHIALKMLRAWGMGEDFHGGVVATIRTWIDEGMQGPIPWPGGAIFEAWAEGSGYANVGGSVGFRLIMKMEPINGK
jgi:hypothetical protein